MAFLEQSQGELAGAQLGPLPIEEALHQVAGEDATGDPGLSEVGDWREGLAQVEVGGLDDDGRRLPRRYSSAHWISRPFLASTATSQGWSPPTLSRGAVTC